MKVDKTFLLQQSIEVQQSTTHLLVGAIQPESHVAGPGTRAVLWVTGCNRRCPGCIKPEFLSFEAGHVFSITEIAERLLCSCAITGVTYSGGEPFEQATALGELSKILKANNLNVLSYSGYRLEALEREPSRFAALLDQLDWLIDGEYRSTEEGPLQYLGSQNQRLLQRIEDGTFTEFPVERRHEIQITLGSDGLRITGFPNADFESAFQRSLAKRGIALEDSHLDRLRK